MTSADSIAPDELEGLFGPFTAATEKPCALAVSGGGDSTALMVLFADWLRQRGADPARHVVLTVDHGLRTSSSAEARAVAERAGTLGLRHAALIWEEPKPSTGIQAAARDARYGLIAAYMRVHGIGSVFTAHTRDDQAETLLMRLARGSGVDGLAAMTSRAPLIEAEGADFDTLEILRPLLGTSKARLLATLTHRGIPWFEDPSNRAAEFERPRLRAAQSTLETLGLSAEMLALSATRLQRAREALEDAADGFCKPGAGNIEIEPWGRILIDRRRLGEQSAEIVVRVLARAIAAAGGSDEPSSLAKLESIVAALRVGAAGAPSTWTLARAIISVSERAIVVEREPGRTPLPRLMLEPGASVLWDGRFKVSMARDAPFDAIEVGPLGERDFAELKATGTSVAVAPARAAALTPAVRQGGRLIAAPPLGHWSTPEATRHFKVVFAGIRNARARRMF